MQEQEFENLLSAIETGGSLPENLDKIENINKFDKNKFSPLMLACERGNVKAVNSLLKVPGIDINQNNGPPNYENAMIICANTEFEWTKQIVKALVKHPSIDKKSLDRALIYFSACGDVEFVEFCLNKGADINAKYLENTALTEAVENEKIDVVNRLLEEPTIDVDKTNYREETPLIIAICKKNINIINIFLNFSLKESQCKLDHVSPLFGTPLTAAIFHDLNDVAMKIIKDSPNFNPDDHPGALNWAIRKQNIKLTKELVERGASINEVGNKNYPEDLPNWLWQEVEPFESPFYPDRRSPVFDLPIFLALNTQNIAIVELILHKVEFDKKGVHGKSLSEFIEKERIDEKIYKLIQQYLKNSSEKSNQVKFNETMLNSVLASSTSFFNQNTVPEKESIKEQAPDIKPHFEINKEQNVINLVIPLVDGMDVETVLQDEAFAQKLFGEFIAQIKYKPVISITSVK